MNTKSKKFTEMVKKHKISCFNEETIKDELNTVLFRSVMEIEGQILPLVVIVDDSIYVISRVLVSGKCINDENRVGVGNFINKLNSNYKAFKFYTTEAGEIVLDTCIPTTAEQFEPDMVRALIDLAVKCLEENYRDLMKIVWTGTASNVNAAIQPKADAEDKSDTKSENEQVKGVSSKGKK